HRSACGPAGSDTRGTVPVAAPAPRLAGPFPHATKIKTEKCGKARAGQPSFSGRGYATLTRILRDSQVLAHSPAERLLMAPAHRSLVSRRGRPSARKPDIRCHPVVNRPRIP